VRVGSDARGGLQYPSKQWRRRACTQPPFCGAHQTWPCRSPEAPARRKHRRGRNLTDYV